MRRRLLVSTVGVAVAVLLLLVFPILVVLRDTAQAEESRLLELDADRAMELLEQRLASGRDLPESFLLSVTPPDTRLEVLDGGRVVASAGVSVGPDPLTALSRAVDSTTVRLSRESRGLGDRLGADIVSLGTLVLVGVAAAAAISIVQTRRLARPFEQLAAAAERIGSGDFSATIPTDSGLDELDDIGRALASSATRLDQMFAAERSFTGDATHQLRTGLTGISLRLEMLAMHADPQVTAEAEAALAQTGQLNETIDELLELARQGRVDHRETFDLGVLVRDHVFDWHRAYSRRMRTIVVEGDATVVEATPGFAGQVIDLLLSNSLDHGAGTTTVVLDGPRVDVHDQGSGVQPSVVADLFVPPPDPGAPHGRGLPLARRLAEADGGGLDLVDPGSARFRYTLLVAVD